MWYFNILMEKGTKKLSLVAYALHLNYSRD